LEGTAALPARGSVPRFSDRRTFVRWIGVLLAPAVVLALLAGFVPVSFGTEIFVLGASAGLTGIAAVLMIAYLRPERVR